MPTGSACGGVNSLGEVDNSDASFVQGFDLRNEVSQRTTEPIEAPNHQRFVLAEVLQACIELQAAGCRVRDRISVRLLATSRTYRVQLKVQFLLAIRHTGISDAHARGAPNRGASC
jgi:hypothetical protein